VIEAGGCAGTTPEGKFGCLVDHGQTSLGSTALAVVALAEYGRTGKGTFHHDDPDGGVRLWMQRDDILPALRVAEAADEETAPLLRWRGGAGHGADAWSRGGPLPRSAERALTTGRLVRHLRRRLPLRQEHWTCIAAEPWRR
jgi:hypothetical protein